MAQHPSGIARQRRAPVSTAEPVAEVVPRHRAHHTDGEDQGQAQLAPPHEVAGHREDGLFGKWEPHVPENDHDEDGDVSPVSDQLREVGHPDRRRHETAARFTAQPGAGGSRSDRRPPRRSRRARPPRRRRPPRSSR